MKKNAFKLLALLAVSTFCIPLNSCKEDQKTVKPLVIEFKKEGELIFKTANDSVIKKMDIEIADDAYQTQTGLMYRDDLGEDQGMLFVFPEDDFRFFYMKNTKIALDIIYIGSNKKIVSFQKNAIPYDETSLPSEVPAQYVLEVNAGTADQIGIKVGDHIEFTKF